MKFVLGMHNGLTTTGKSVFRVSLSPRLLMSGQPSTASTPVGRTASPKRNGTVVKPSLFSCLGVASARGGF